MVKPMGETIWLGAKDGKTKILDSDLTEIKEIDAGGSPYDVVEVDTHFILSVQEELHFFNKQTWNKDHTMDLERSRRTNCMIKLTNELIVLGCRDGSICILKKQEGTNWSIVKSIETGINEEFTNLELIGDTLYCSYK